MEHLELGKARVRSERQATCLTTPMRVEPTGDAPSLFWRSTAGGKGEGEEGEAGESEESHEKLEGCFISRQPLLMPCDRFGV